MIREMQIRNYSERTIQRYVASISKLTQFFNLPPEAITVDQFKEFLHHLISVDKASVSLVNQAPHPGCRGVYQALFAAHPAVRFL